MIAIPFKTTFRTLRKSLAPSWLTEEEGELVGYSIDLMKDAFTERLYLGLLARFPGTAPPDALAEIGRQRRVIQGINESAESYAARCIRWLSDRKRNGNPLMLLQKLAEYTGSSYGCSFRTVDTRGNWFSRAADGTESYSLKQANWNWDNGAASRWSRFWVIIYPGTLWTASPAWGYPGTPSWGDPGGTWGSTATPEQVATVRAIVADWMGAGRRCINIILAFDPASFDPAAAVDASGMPDGLWENWSREVGGVQVPARLGTARYWDGV